MALEVGSSAEGLAATNRGWETYEDDAASTDEVESSAVSHCSSYSYDPADFPRANEYEEFMSPSFQWPDSSTASFASSTSDSLVSDGGVDLSVVVIFSSSFNRRVLAKPIQLAIIVAKTAREVQPAFRGECQFIKAKAEQLLMFLRQAAGADLYEQPALRIIGDTEEVLDKALMLLMKYRAQGNFVRRVFTTIPANTFKNISLRLEIALKDVFWLLHLLSASSAGNDGDGYRVMPPIAANEPILFLIWEQVAKLLKGSPDEKADAALALASLARGNDRYGNLIIEEGGVGPLLKLVKEGKVEAQESATQALGLLGRYPENVEVMVQAGVCSAFTKVLKEAPMKVQAMVAWAVSELANHYPRCQDDFAQNNIVWVLVRHLASETVQENPANIDSVVSTKANAIRTRDEEDPATRSRMKAMAARALWALAKGNSPICKSITESRALLCFSVLLEKGTEEIQYHSAMALMEIARVAEKDPELRRFAFKPTSPAAKAVVDQLLRVVQKADYSDLLLPSIIALGCLSNTLRATETRIIAPLVKLLNEQDQEVTLQSAIALTKFAETYNQGR